jgi:hypothetical protein
MHEYSLHIKQTLGKIGLLAIVVTGGAFISGHGTWIWGFLFGSMASVIYFFLMCYRIKNSADLPPEKAVAYMRSGWGIRLVFVSLVVIFALKTPQIDFLAAVVGLLSLHIVIILHGITIVIRSLLYNQQSS